LTARAIDKAQVQDSIAKSMARMGVDHFDYLLLHEALPHFLSDEALQYLMDLRFQSITGKLGIATSSVNIATLDNGGIENWDVLQYENAIQYKSDSLVNTFKGKEHISQYF